MSTENANVAVENAQSPAKRNRRGVSNKTRAVSQLKFHEKDAAQNGLFVAHLDTVSVDWSESKDDAKQFAGCKVPRVTIHFASNQKDANEQRHVYYTLNPVESSVDTMEGGKDEWRVNNIFQWMKHILEVYYLKGREMTETEEDALCLPFSDCDDEGNYVPIEPEEVLAGYRVIFDNFVAMMNGSFGLKEGEVAKPVFKTADGRFIPAWIKLLRHKKVKGEWRDVAQNGELGFDSFIGNGVVEIMKNNQPPVTLRIDLAKESITPKQTSKKPSVGVPSMGAPMAGGIAGGFAEMPNMGTGNWNDAAMAADSDMPF